MDPFGTFVEEISGLVNAFSGSDNTPHNLAEFIGLVIRLRSFYDYYHDVHLSEEGVESEKYLVWATMLCLTCFVTRFEDEVLTQELHTSTLGTTVHPAYQELERLLVIAVEYAKLFKDKELEGLIHKSAELVVGFIPTPDPPQLGRAISESVNTSEFLSLVNSSFGPAVSSGNVAFSSARNKVDAPSISNAFQITSPHVIDVESNMALFTPTSRRLLEEMDVEDIISGGLGLSIGRRERAHELEDNSRLAFPITPTPKRKQEASFAVAQSDTENSPSRAAESEPKARPGRKRKARVTNTSGMRRQKKKVPNHA